MFYFIADGNAEIGAGHLMRCLTIADALAKLARVSASTAAAAKSAMPLSSQSFSTSDICFICAHESSAEFARKRGYQAIVSEKRIPIRRSLASLPQDLTESRIDFSADTRNVLFVDSYDVTDEYLMSLRDYGIVAYIDDHMSQSYPVDIVFGCSAGASEETFSKLYQGTNCRCFIGSEYVLVREGFFEADYQLREDVRDILITTGGGDSENYAGRILEAIYGEKYECHLVAGRFNPHKEWLSDFAAARRGVHIYQDVQDMVGLMARCDLAVTAGGNTIYELAALGVPFICFSYAENQKMNTAYIKDHDIAGYAGEMDRQPKETLTRIGDWLREMSSDFAKRKRYHTREKALTDGRGAEKVAEVLRNCT